MGRFAGVRRGAVVAVAVVVAAAGCARGGNETAAAPAPLPPAPPVTAPGTTVDPAKAACDAVWSLATFVYTATVTTDVGVAEREDLRRGIAESEPSAAARVPALAADLATLASHAGWVLDSRAKVAPPEDVGAATRRVVAYLTDTCHLQMG